MKAHVGVDSKTKIIHTAVATGQRRRLGGAARSLARRRNAGVGRSGVSRTDRTDSRVCAPGAGLYPSALPLQGSGGRSRAGEEPDEVDGALEGGARVWGDEAEVRICEATLSRAEEECQPAVCRVRAGEPVSGAEKTVASGTGLVWERRLRITGEPPNGRKAGKNRIQTLAPAWQNTYYLEDTGLFRVSLTMAAETVAERIPD